MSRKKNEIENDVFESDAYEKQPENEDLGEVKISDDVIAICAVNATLKTEGVAKMYTGITDSISQMLGKESVSKGAKISQSDEGTSIDLFIVVEYGTNIPDVAFSIQQNVKKEIETMADKEVTAVNIHVQGVELPEDKENEEEEEEEEE